MATAGVRVAAGTTRDLRSRDDEYDDQGPNSANATGTPAPRPQIGSRKGAGSRGKRVPGQGYSGWKSRARVCFDLVPQREGARVLSGDGLGREPIHGS